MSCCEESPQVRQAGVEAGHYPNAVVIPVDHEDALLVDNRQRGGSRIEFFADGDDHVYLDPEQTRDLIEELAPYAENRSSSDRVALAGDCQPIEEETPATIMEDLQRLYGGEDVSFAIGEPIGHEGVDATADSMAAARLRAALTGVAGAVRREAESAEDAARLVEESYESVARYISEETAEQFAAIGAGEPVEQVVVTLTLEV